MKISTLFLGLFLLYANSASAQSNLSIIDIIDNLGLIDFLFLDNPQNILDEINLEKACNAIRNQNWTTSCARQLEVICNDQKNLIRMLDANSKFPYTGMLVRTKIDLGSFDECVELDVTQNETNILGKYCLNGLIIPTTPLNDSDLIEKAYKLATCIPDQCSAMDLLEMLNLTDIYPLFNDFNCQTKNSYKQLGWDDYAVISLFAALFLVLVLATLLEVIYCYTKKDHKNLFIEAFSVLHNSKKIFSTSERSREQIGVLHGIRVVAMFYIVVGHAYVSMEAIPGYDIEFIDNFKKSWKSIYIMRSYLDVDSFFFLSGLLFAYQYLKLKPTNLLNHVRRIPMLIFHRYIRITPVAASAYLIVTTVLAHLGDGPIYQDLVKPERETCIKHWWSYFLYLQNYANYDHICILPTWYLSADFQLFLIAPLVLIPVAIYIKSHFKLVMGHLALLNVLVTILPVAYKLWFKEFDKQVFS
ncbi:unnamed protein product [Ceutorhynchus assimilis]|uniref:Nose resistant-to-fluoxetine protein N-terminal domain-containing protein n=1 Tax=Ceutorhynchus assimilis TaxID=467358 RepID=A0A9N9MN96_9CUCU|nr:unnamed protein product [Ceutorhynchus assimilis]